MKVKETNKRILAEWTIKEHDYKRQNMLIDIAFVFLKILFYRKTRSLEFPQFEVREMKLIT